jgi:hypothetical protein
MQRVALLRRLIEEALQRAWRFGRLQVQTVRMLQSARVVIEVGDQLGSKVLELAGQHADYRFYLLHATDDRRDDDHHVYVDVWKGPSTLMIFGSKRSYAAGEDSLLGVLTAAVLESAKVRLLLL